MNRKNIKFWFLTLTVFLAVFIFYKVDSAIALMDPYISSPEYTESRLRTLERERLNQEVRDYESPEASTAKLLMKLSQEQQDEERLKKEIKQELGKQNQTEKTVQPTKKSCSELLGENSKYDSSLKQCVCLDGFKQYKGSCLDRVEYGNNYCKETQGINSRYNPDEDNCITNEDYCKKTLGNNSQYSINDDKCQCVSGFVLDGNNCVVENNNTIAANEEQPVAEANQKGIKESIISFFKKLKFW